MNDKSTVCGIILAGGMSRRLGRNKAVEEFNGSPLISHVIDRISSITNETIIVVNNQERASQLPLPDSAKVAVDIYPDKGSLGGIFTGLSASESHWGIVVACDMPFLNTQLLEHMLSLRNGSYAIVPVLSNRPEPINAIYSKYCLSKIQHKIENDDLKISGLFEQIKVKWVSKDTIDAYDPNHISFFNINTQKDLDRAINIIPKSS